jgi:hypothetical protein
MTATTDTDADLAAIRSDLSSLKGDVARLIEHFRVRRRAAFKTSPIKLQTPFAAAMRTLPRMASKPPKRSVFGSGGNRFSRLASRSELVTSALGRSRGEAVRPCARFHRTHARLSSTQDLSTDTSRQDRRNDDFATHDKTTRDEGKLRWL